jgi:mono/diheme cytochrome c family protein
MLKSVSVFETPASLFASKFPRPAAQRRASALHSGMFALLMGIATISAATITSAAPPAPSAHNDSGQAARGRYLAIAADCMACHTAQHAGKPFAGGYGIQTPIGLVYSSNITPSKTAGIGNYSEAQFSAALKKGIRADGSHLYPAMPYTSYAKLTDNDVSAMYVYFMQGVQPVDTPNPKQTALQFPFNIRASMAVWNALFLDDKPLQPDASKSAEWNRGMYLSQGLAHCSACHTPRNDLMAERKDVDLSGAALGGWYAPNITSDKVAGIGGWTHEELYRYLKSGAVNGKAQAAGPMAEAIENSLQHLNDADLKAVVTYLKDTKPVAAAGVDKPRYAYGKASDSEAQFRGTADADKGWKIFSASCAACHQINATGVANGDYPSLFHNTATGSEHPDNLIATVLYGLTRTVGDKTRFMPAFGPPASYTERLSDEDIAQVSNYVLTQYGNPAVKVTKEDVATVRNGGPTPLIARLASYGVAAALIAATLVIGLIVFLITRRRRRKFAASLKA